MHNIIKTPNYLLIVDDSKIELGSWHTCIYPEYPLEARFTDESTKYDICKGCRNIIAHLPLNNAPTLEGVDLLPPLEPIGFDEFQYTEEDMKKAFEAGQLDKGNNWYGGDFIQFIQSFQQLKIPIEFNLEAKNTHIQNGVLIKSYWVGEYIY